MDTQSPTIKLLVKGQEVCGCIINGSSGVNVINEATSNPMHDMSQFGAFYDQMLFTNSFSNLPF